MVETVEEVRHNRLFESKGLVRNLLQVGLTRGALVVHAVAAA